MNKPKYLAFDTETGGLNPTRNPILTAFFGIIGEDSALIDELYLFIRPDDKFSEVEAGALAVNKIDMKKHLEDPRTVSREVAGKQLVDFLKKYQPRKYPGLTQKLKPMAYNIGFDFDMVTTQLISRDEWDKLLHYGKVDPKMIVDFLKEDDIGLLPPELGRLESLVKYFGIPDLGAHEARNDTLAMVEAYRKLKEVVANKKTDSVSFDILSLLEK